MFVQGCIYTLDIIPIKTLSDAMDLEVARLEEDSSGEEIPDLLDEDETAALLEKVRITSE